MSTTLASDADLIADIEQFLAAHEMPPTTFGRRAIGDANLIEDLRAGRELRRATESKVRSFMATFDAQRVAVCPRCDARADHPSVAACTSPRCPLARHEQEAA